VFGHGGESDLSMTFRRTLITLLGGVVLGAVVFACDVVDAPPNPDGPLLVIDPVTPTTSVGETTTTPVCRPELPADAPIGLSGSPVEQSIALAQRWSGCSQAVVLTRPAGLSDAAGVASAMHAPLLVWDPTAADALVEVIRSLGVSEIIATSPTIRPDIDVPVTVVVPESLSDPESGTVWYVSETTTDPALMAYLASLNGASAIVGTAVDQLDESQRRLLGSAARVVWSPEPTPTQQWQLSLLVEGIATVNGTSDLLANTRFVAFYGNPTTGALGVLGEQGPQATLDRMTPIVEQYAADGALTVPTFEIIATVADAPAGADGDYSAEMGPELIRPWVDLATANGGYVVLDLQPGRTDFLTQAKRYEEFLRLPNVGLALDPEWRLGPDEFHLRQIGSVDAAEVNLVSEWLAGVVREELLPQKLFIVHQFRFDMIENREQIELRPELATVIQMDGQGPLPTKYETFGALTGPADADRFAWGWKNFYDEDSPMATPAQVLDLVPLPVFVSFQ
jgi:hypothetical protein